ncbi:hypothetical protein NDU88_005594 [Pleurodeles waltl]|uniref:Uncharacterized protein n=1 Tax=Pleurodeles waltl TaxID=8319 RepID=A0AAV7VNC5_PLEWA|nr:hypothetical protein NDU88_005594 [Pleurodeles waltl]
MWPAGPHEEAQESLHEQAQESRSQEPATTAQEKQRQARRCSGGQAGDQEIQQGVALGTGYWLANNTAALRSPNVVVVAPAKNGTGGLMWPREWKPLRAGILVRESCGVLTASHWLQRLRRLQQQREVNSKASPSHFLAPQMTRVSHSPHLSLRMYSEGMHRHGILQHS